MPGAQSWEIRVVCLIQVQKCMDLAHSIGLELESLESSLFTTLHLQNGRIDHLTPWQFCDLGKKGKGIHLKNRLL